MLIDELKVMGLRGSHAGLIGGGLCSDVGIKGKPSSVNGDLEKLKADD